MGGLGAGSRAEHLQKLVLKHAIRQEMEGLAAIYAAGGLIHLRTLTFESAYLGDDGIRALLEAVEATKHRGAALRKWNIYARLESTVMFSRVRNRLEQAQQRGVFPNAQLNLQATE